MEEFQRQKEAGEIPETEEADIYAVSAEQDGVRKLNYLQAKMFCSHIEFMF